MEQEKKDIQSQEDVKLLVNRFYDRVRLNAVIGPIFKEVIKDEWPLHLEKMYRFWGTILLDHKTYLGSPFPPHAKLPVDKAHFDTWLQLWQTTVDNFFSGPRAEAAKWRAEKMAVLFLSKIQYYRQTGKTPLL